MRRKNPCPPGSTGDICGAAACAAPDAHVQVNAPPLGAESIAATHERVTSQTDHLRLKRDLIQHLWDARSDAKLRHVLTKRKIGTKTTQRALQTNRKTNREKTQTNAATTRQLRPPTAASPLPLAAAAALCLGDGAGDKSRRRPTAPQRPTPLRLAAAAAYTGNVHRMSVAFPVPVRSCA